MRFIRPTFSRLLVLALLALGAFACTDNGTGGGTTAPLDPFVSFLNESGAITSDASVGPGETFRVKLNLQRGDADLQSVRIQQDGSNVATSRLSFNSGLTTAQNPLLLVGDDKQGAELIVDVDAHDMGTSTYTFTVADEDGLSDAISLDISVFSGDLQIAFVDEAPFLNDDTEVDSQTTFSVKLNASRGATAIANLTVLQDSEVIADLSRLNIDGSAFSANPLPISSEDANGFEAEIDVQSHAGGAARYTFRIEDSQGNSEQVSLNLLVGENVDGTFTMIVVNNRSGMLQGGLDLDEPATVAFNSPQAELRDQGIDTDVPSSSNWIQKLEVVGTTGLVMVGNNDDDEDLDFDAVNSKQAVRALYEDGNPMAETTVLNIGDVIAVKRAANSNDYWLLLLTDLVVTPNDNNDFYEFTVKQALDVQ